MDQEEPIKGRGSSWNPANRFERIEYVAEREEGEESSERRVETELLKDSSRSLLTRNDSPDVGFDVSINPYRGCEHGCCYCYARPFHEYLGFSAGLDFETKILVKTEAPRLLRRELMSARWKPEVVALSGVTDPYQPAEKRLELTRQCLQVLLEFRNPAAVITKNYLVTRDLDLLGELAALQAAAVNISITSLDGELQRLMEPRASTPVRRLAAVRALAGAGIPVRVLLGPVIPGLTDHEIPAILAESARAGARSAGYILLRLPYGVKDLFEGWLEAHFPHRKDKVLGRLREMRGGRLYDSEFHTRMRGEGLYADQIRALFHSACRKNGLNREPIALSAAAFRRPGRHDQLSLFKAAE